MERHFSRSLFIAEDVKKGEVLTEKNIRSVRPSNGMHTKYYGDIIGQKVNQDIKKELQWSGNILNGMIKGDVWDI